MNAIMDKARAEAEPDDEPTPEPEPGEPTPEPEPEPEPAPESPASQMTEQEAEREFKKLEKLAETYLPKALALAEKLGIPAQACPLCTFPGLAIPRTANEVTSDVEAAVLGMIGKSAPPDLKMATDAEGCPDCDGEGDVLTGAKKEIARTKPCTRCGGKGWVQKSPPPFVPQANGAPTYPGADQTFTPLPQGIPDAWGRPAGHVHWGIDPAQVGV